MKANMIMLLSIGYMSYRCDAYLSYTYVCIHES